MFTGVITLYSQQTAVVNTQKIIEKMQEYTVAKIQLDSIRAAYDSEISAELKKVEILYNVYQTQKSSLSDSQRKIKENEIIVKERAVKDLQKKYLSQDGDLAKRSAELLDPVKKKISVAVAAVAEELKILLIFDSSSVPGIVYSNPKADITDAVLKKLNLQ